MCSTTQPRWGTEHIFIEEDLTESTFARLAQSSHDVAAHIQFTANRCTRICLPYVFIDSDTSNKQDKSFQN